MNFNFTDLFKNLGDVKKEMETIKERVARMHIVGEAGAGMVTVTVSGDGKVINMKIDPGLLSKENKDMLEELLISATNEALEHAREAWAHEFKKLTGGIPLAGLANLFGGGK